MVTVVAACAVSIKHVSEAERMAGSSLEFMGYHSDADLNDRLVLIVFVSPPVLHG
jgi:hypothetical protein